MTRPSRSRIVILGMLTAMPVAGVVWQYAHYLRGLQDLGYDVHYVEDHGVWPEMLLGERAGDGSREAVNFIGAFMKDFALGDRWAFRARHSDGQVYGLSAQGLKRLLREAALIINMHGGTVAQPEHSESGRLVWLDTDPVPLQIALDNGEDWALDAMRAHVQLFSFAENIGERTCLLPVSQSFPFVPTRQPVVLDFWSMRPEPRDVFTTIGNWKQSGDEVVWKGRRYTWSKDVQFKRFLSLPERADQVFELALSSYEPRDKILLERHGWRVVDALSKSLDWRTYREYVCTSLGEFTAAKEQNVHFRTGWFSDRSATYLAAGRPVVTQDTGFGCILPTGKGLFSYRTLDEAVGAIQEIQRDVTGNEKAAQSIAQEYFRHDVVLGALLESAGLKSRITGASSYRGLHSSEQ